MIHEFLSAILFSTTSFFQQPVLQRAEQVNAVLGDESLTEKFGVLPDASADETLRVQTHLEYVERLLRSKDVSHLPLTLRATRTRMLDLLHEYQTAGVFPRNFDFPGCRKPCFIDRDENICAVGNLVEKTAGRETAEAISDKHRYKTIFEMDDALVNAWIARSGLTRQECAMIQPTYGHQPNYYVDPVYGKTSAAFGGVNALLSVANGMQIAKRRTSTLVPLAGAIGGGAQIIWGGWIQNKGTDGDRILGFANMGFGTATVALSVWNLLAEDARQTAGRWNVRGFAVANGGGVGFSRSF